MVPGVRALIRPRFLLAVAVAGVAAGLIGIAMALLLELFEALFYGVAHGGLLERLAAAPPWRRVLAPAAEAMRIAPSLLPIPRRWRPDAGRPRGPPNCPRRR